MNKKKLSVAFLSLIILGVMILGVACTAKPSSEKGTNTTDVKTSTTETTTDTTKVASTETPAKDEQAPTETPVPSTTATTSSSNAGTDKDPVKLGSTYSWSDVSPSASFGYKADFEMTITKAVKLTDAEMTAMKVNKKDDPKLDYVKASLNFKAKNVTPTTVKGTFLYYTVIKPKVWGTISETGTQIIGADDSGYDGSMTSNLNTKYPSGKNKVDVGSTAEIDYSGDVVIAIEKGKTNYLIINKLDDKLDRNEKKIYFAIE